MYVNASEALADLENVPLPNNINFNVTSLSLDTSLDEPTIVTGLSDEGAFHINAKYTATIDGNANSCSNVDTLNLNYQVALQKDTDDEYQAVSTTINNNEVVNDTIVVDDTTYPRFNISGKNLIVNKGLEALNVQYSTPFIDEDGDGKADSTEILLTSGPGQKPTGQVNGCAIDFESTYCTVVGATFASMGEINQKCQFETYNSTLGFGQLAINDTDGLIPFVLTGMTDINQTGALTLNSSAASRISSVLSPTSSQWTVTEFIDVNDLNEFVGLAKVGNGPTLPIIGRTAVLPSPTKLRARAFFIRNNDTTYDRVELTWNGVFGAKHYELFELDETTGQFNELLVNGSNQTSNQYIDIENVPDAYTLAIRACNDAGCGFLSEPVTFRTDQDTDGDGLLDREELEFGTDINAQDSDGDGLSDYQEQIRNTNPQSSDTDADGLTDNYEVLNGLNPTNDDTDSDGLKDGDEVNVYLTQANNEDTDGDGRLDGEEVNGLPVTDPLNPDSDGDGLTDGAEVNGTPATDPNSVDTDGDGLSDSYEVNSPLALDPTNSDSDGDLLSDGAEVNVHNSSPVSIDTDNDGLNDYVEVMTHLTNPIAADTDGDGLSDFVEVEQYQTNPISVDTDGDGLTDGHEILGLFDAQGNQTSPAVGTSATDADSDDDGISDGDEVNYVSPLTGASLNPLSNDTDADGLEDNFELRLGLDPTDATDANKLIWVPISSGGIDIFIPVIKD